MRTEIEAHRFPLQSMAKDLWHKVADKEKSGKGVGSTPCSLPFTLISLHHSRCLAYQAKVLHEPRTAGTLSPPIACRQPPTMRCTSIRADAESFTRRRDVTGAMGRLQQQLLGRQSRLHALGQSDASLAAPSMKHVRTPPMMRLRVPLFVSVLSCRRHSDLRPALLSCHGLTPCPPMNAISHRAWPTAVAREGPGTKVPWVMERCAAHIEQYGLQVGSAPDHPCRLGTLA